MGDKNINLSASIKVGRKPKDGKDGTSVTILATKVLYQVSASPTDIPTSWVEDIKNAIQTDSKPYLWSKTIVAYSDNNKTVTFSVSYKGKDGTNGTSFTPKGMADGYYSKATEIPAYSDEQNGKIYIVDDATNVISPFIVPDAPYVAQYVLHNGEYVLYLVHAEFGDGYNVNGHLYVANDDKWVDFGEIQGAKGEQGDPGIDGKDAINIVFSPAELVFDANENGNLKQSEKSAEIKVYRGTTELNYKTDWDNDAEIGDNCRAALLVNTTTNKPEVKISGITSSMIDDVKVPATSGGAKVSVIIDKVTYRAYLPFSVNVNTYANFLIRDNKKYISKYTEVSNKYDAVSAELDNKASKADLKTVESTIEQTAENIKLEVLSKTSGRRNMLVNSALRNQDSVFIHSLARIEKNTGVDGVNCIHSSDKYSGTGEGNYIGAFWDSTQKNGVVTNIPISKGKTYVLSCWIKSDNLDLPFNIECLYMKSINQQSRSDAKGAKSESFKVTEKNKWQKITCVLDTNNADATEYLAVNFWSNNNKDVPKVTDANGKAVYPTCHAYICKPMMEEGDTYSGWTLSDGDYDYVGGNMIDNARTLEVGGSLKSINENNVADYGLAYYGDSMSLRINNTNADSAPSIMMFQPSLEVGVDYMFSFLAKGTANIGLYALCDNSVDGDYLLSEDSVNADVRIVDTFRNRYASIILIPTQLTTEYKRYWGHIRFYGHVPTKLYLQLNHAGEVYICQPKLEIGATMTEFTERKTDLVDKASLKKAGIEITTDKVKLYGDKVEVVTTKIKEDGTKEDTLTTMFSNGKLNANLIDADAIEVKHLWAKSEDGTTKVGYFGNTEKMDACKVDDTTYAPLFIGANNAKNAPFHVTQEGAIYALMGRIGKFSLTDNGIFEYDDGYNTAHKPMRLSESLICFTHTTDHTTNDRIIWMGYTTHIFSDYGINSLISDIWIDDRESRPNESKACLVLHAEGGTSEQSNLFGEPSGNFAICASKGMYAGFRPMTRTISKSMALSELDCYVEVTAAVTLTLPANPQRGQTYWIMRSVGKGVKTIVKGNGKQVYTPAGNGETVEFTSANEIIWLTYIKDNWKALWVTP